MYYGGHVAVLLGVGDGTFHPATSIPAANTALSLLATDLNGDGAPDLAVAEMVPKESPQSLLPGEIDVLLGNGDGTFRPRTTYAAGLWPEYIQAGDINEDGKVDLAAANALTNDISLYLGLGEGRFAPEQRMRAGAAGSLDVFDVHAEAAPGLQLADFNGDGHLDMAAVQTITSRVALFEGDGRGRFVPAGAYDTPGFPEPFLATDLNRDGCLDLAVPGNLPPVGPADATTTRVSVLLNATSTCTELRRSPDSAPARCTPARSGLMARSLRLRGRWLSFRTRRGGAVRIVWTLREGRRLTARTPRRLQACRSYRLRTPAGVRRAELHGAGRVQLVRRGGT